MAGLLPINGRLPAALGVSTLVKSEVGRRGVKAEEIGGWPLLNVQQGIRRVARVLAASVLGIFVALRSGRRAFRERERDRDKTRLLCHALWPPNVGMHVMRTHAAAPPLKESPPAAEAACASNVSGAPSTRAPSAPRTLVAQRAAQPAHRLPPLTHVSTTLTLTVLEGAPSTMTSSWRFKRPSMPRPKVAATDQPLTTDSGYLQGCRRDGSGRGVY